MQLKLGFAGDMTFVGEVPELRFASNDTMDFICRKVMIREFKDSYYSEQELFAFAKQFLGVFINHWCDDSWWTRETLKGLLETKIFQVCMWYCITSEAVGEDDPDDVWNIFYKQFHDQEHAYKEGLNSWVVPVSLRVKRALAGFNSKVLHNGSGQYVYSKDF